MTAYRRLFLVGLMLVAIFGFMSQPQTTRAQQAAQSQTVAKMKTGTPTHGVASNNMAEWYLNGHATFTLKGLDGRISVAHAADFGFDGSELLEKTGISDFANTFGGRFEAKPNEMLEFSGEADCNVDGWDEPHFLEQSGEGYGDHWTFWVRLTDGRVITIAEADSRGREYRFRVWAKHSAVRIYTDARAHNAAVLQPAIDNSGPFYSFDTIPNGPDRRRTKNPIVIALDMNSWPMGQCATFGFTLKTMGWGAVNGILVSSLVTKNVEQPGDIERTRNVPGLFDGLTGGYFTGHPCGNCELPKESVCFDSPLYWANHQEYYSGKVYLPGYNFNAAVDARDWDNIVQSVLKLNAGTWQQRLVARYVAAQLGLNRQFHGQFIPPSALSANRWELIRSTEHVLSFGGTVTQFQQLIQRWDDLLGTDPNPQCYKIPPCPCPKGQKCDK